jgi:hypothetical protein
MTVESSDRPAQVDPLPRPEQLASMCDLLRLARLQCGGDLDKFLLLLAVAVRDAPGAPAVAGARGPGAYAQSLAAALSAPRETVRRKMADMVAAGWLSRESGRLRLTSAGHDRLAPVWPLLRGRRLSGRRTPPGLRSPAP